MNPITHLFVGWTLADATIRESRDRAIVAWASVVPDIDGLSMIPDIANRILGRPYTDYFFRYHHMLTHGLPAAIVCGLVAFGISRNRWRTAGLAFLSFHLHLLCDFLGSRGPDPGDVWPISYLQPISDKLVFSWSGQWQLNAWPNILLTLILMAFILARSVRTGDSPVSLFSRKADSVFVSTLRARFRWSG